MNSESTTSLSPNSSLESSASNTEVVKQRRFEEKMNAIDANFYREEGQNSWMAQAGLKSNTTTLDTAPFESLNDVTQSAAIAKSQPSSSKAEASSFPRPSLFFKSPLTPIPHVDGASSSSSDANYHVMTLANSDARPQAMGSLDDSVSPPGVDWLSQDEESLEPAAYSPASPLSIPQSPVTASISPSASGIEGSSAHSILDRYNEPLNWPALSPTSPSWTPNNPQLFDGIYSPIDVSLLASLDDAEQSQEHFEVASETDSSASDDSHDSDDSDDSALGEELSDTEFAGFYLFEILVEDTEPSTLNDHEKEDFIANVQVTAPQAVVDFFRNDEFVCGDELDTTRLFQLIYGSRVFFMPGCYLGRYLFLTKYSPDAPPRFGRDSKVDRDFLVLYAAAIIRIQPLDPHLKRRQQLATSQDIKMRWTEAMSDEDIEMGKLEAKLFIHMKKGDFEMVMSAHRDDMPFANFTDEELAEMGADEETFADEQYYDNEGEEFDEYFHGDVFIEYYLENVEDDEEHEHGAEE